MRIEITHVTVPRTPSVRHTLYTLACQADARYSAVIDARTNGRRTRWTLTREDAAIPEVAEAYRAKLVADEAWLTYLRTSARWHRGSFDTPTVAF